MIRTQPKPPKLKVLKPNRCKHCKVRLTEELARHKLHPDCVEPWWAIQRGKQERARVKAAKALAARDRRETRAKLIEKKGRGYWIAVAQKEFNTFIRLRDQLAGHPCISSGRPLNWTGNAVDAGHYRSRGSAPHLRFDERNCHAQSKQENRYASGNVVDYRLGLIARIGLEAVEALEADQEPRKWSIDDLKAIKATYAAKAKELKVRMG